MTNEESDRILNETTHTGWIIVIIEGTSPIKMDAVGEPLRLLASNAACLASGDPIITDQNNNPWLLISYDKDAGVLIVKKKPA